MTPDIRIFPAQGVWSVRADGAVVAESRAALEVTVGDAPYVIYFPPADVATAFLDPSDTVTTCPHRGPARHFNIVTQSGTLADAGWSYDSPPEGFAQLRGHLAFDAAKVTIERI